MLVAAPKLTPCVGLFSWSPTDVAPSQSAIAGVLAGFVFGGLVVMLSVRIAARAEQTARALKLLFLAFFGLIVVAYLFADLAGDKNCLRANSEEVVSGAILGTFSIIMIVSLTWLTVAYDVHAHGVLKFLRHLIHVASGFVVLLLCTSSISCLQAEVPHGPSLQVQTSIYLVGGLLYLAALPASSQVVALASAQIARITEWNAPKLSRIFQLGKQYAVERCAWVALSYLGIAAITDAFVLGLSDTVWSHPQVATAYALAWSSLLFSLAVLILALHAMAPVEPDGQTTSAPGSAGALTVRISNQMRAWFNPT